ncbi:MAG: hypothetical protein HQL18_03390, partial [Candidatus Omnitrophica bacterium]|nr:hypothetical protein [Candidatus Omnitrophota bacterium]
MADIQAKGLEIVAAITRKAPYAPNHLRVFYQEHNQKSHFEKLIRYMRSGEVTVLVLWKEQDAVAAWRAMLGKWDGSTPGTVRAKYGVADFEDIGKMQNKAHGSDAPARAGVEIDHMFTGAERSVIFETPAAPSAGNSGVTMLGGFGAFFGLSSGVKGFLGPALAVIPLPACLPWAAGIALAMVAGYWLYKKISPRKIGLATMICSRVVQILALIVLCLAGGAVAGEAKNEPDSRKPVIVKADPNAARVHFDQGLNYGGAGRFAEAVQEYSQVIAVDPTWAKAWGNRGAMYVGLRKPELALEDLTQAIKLDRTSVYHFMNRGAANRQLKRWAEARTDYEEALRLTSDAARIKDIRESIALCDENVRIEAKNVERSFKDSWPNWWKFVVFGLSVVAVWNGLSALLAGLFLGSKKRSPGARIAEQTQKPTVPAGGKPGAEPLDDKQADCVARALGLSATVGRIKGVPLKLHWSLISLLGWAWFLDGATAPVIVACIFASVLLHELGHFYQAYQFGIPVKDIVLHAYGGGVKLAHTGSSPRAELAIAWAGPRVNLMFALVFGCLTAWFCPQGLTSIIGLGNWTNFFAFLWQVNAAMLLLNLIPTFPLDGGRICQAWLKDRFGLSTVRAAGWTFVIGLPCAAVGVLSPGLWQCGWFYCVLVCLASFLGVINWFMAFMQEHEKKEKAQQTHLSSLVPVFLASAAVTLPAWLPWVVGIALVLVVAASITSSTTGVPSMLGEDGKTDADKPARLAIVNRIASTIGEGGIHAKDSM